MQQEKDETIHGAWLSWRLAVEYVERRHARYEKIQNFGWPALSLGGSSLFPSAAVAKVWNTLAYPEKAADGLDELGHRDRLRQIGLATALADALFVALHRKCRHRDHRDDLELGVFLEPFGHLEAGDLRQLNVHQDQIGTALAADIEHIEAVARADGAVAVGLQQVVEELHVELVVLDDHYCLRHL